VPAPFFALTNTDELFLPPVQLHESEEFRSFNAVLEAISLRIFSQKDVKIPQSLVDGLVVVTKEAKDEGLTDHELAYRIVLEFIKADPADIAKIYKAMYIHPDPNNKYAVPHVAAKLIGAVESKSWSALFVQPTFLDLLFEEPPDGLGLVRSEPALAWECIAMVKHETDALVRYLFYENRILKRGSDDVNDTFRLSREPCDAGKWTGLHDDLLYISMDVERNLDEPPQPARPKLAATVRACLHRLPVRVLVSSDSGEAFVRANGVSCQDVQEALKRECFEAGLPAMIVRPAAVLEEERSEEDSDNTAEAAAAAEAAPAMANQKKHQVFEEERSEDLQRLATLRMLDKSYVLEQAGPGGSWRPVALAEMKTGSDVLTTTFHMTGINDESVLPIWTIGRHGVDFEPNDCPQKARNLLACVRSRSDASGAAFSAPAFRWAVSVAGTLLRDRDAQRPFTEAGGIEALVCAAEGLARDLKSHDEGCHDDAELLSDLLQSIHPFVGEMQGELLGKVVELTRDALDGRVSFALALWAVLRSKIMGAKVCDSDLIEVVLAAEQERKQKIVDLFDKSRNDFQKQRLVYAARALRYLIRYTSALQLASFERDQRATLLKAAMKQAIKRPNAAGDLLPLCVDLTFHVDHTNGDEQKAAKKCLKFVGKELSSDLLTRIEESPAIALVLLNLLLASEGEAAPLGAYSALQKAGPDNPNSRAKEFHELFKKVERISNAGKADAFVRSLTKLDYTRMSAQPRLF